MRREITARLLQVIDGMAEVGRHRLVRKLLKRCRRSGVGGVAIAMLAAPAAAVPPPLYHSPADDGVSGGIPATVAAGAPVALHLYLGVGATVSTSDPCFQGDGDELCGYLLRLIGSGVALVSFTPADADTLYNLASGQIDITGGDFQTGDVGPIKVGDLTISGPEGATLDLEVGDFVTTALTKEQAATPVAIVQLPEPGGALPVSLSLALLAALGAARRSRGG
jgi:hypothetical protein